MHDRPSVSGCAGGRLMAVPNGNIRPGGWRCCFAILVVLKGPRTHARTSWPTSRCRWSGNACTRANREAGRGRVPPDVDVQLRQLLREFHPVSHEAHEGQGRSQSGLQAHSGRAGVLRVRGDSRPEGFQNRLRRDHGQPLG